MRQISVQWKITLLAGLCLVFTSLALIGFSIYNARASQQTAKLQSSESVIDKSQQLLQTGALLNATEISEYLSEAIYRAEMLAANALFLKIIQKKTSVKVRCYARLLMKWCVNPYLVLTP